jgi:hypothetical protein
MCLWPAIRCIRCSTSRQAADCQRSTISAVCQFFTRLVKRVIRPCGFSMTLVVSSRRTQEETAGHPLSKEPHIESEGSVPRGIGCGSPRRCGESARGDGRSLHRQSSESARPAGAFCRSVCRFDGVNWEPLHLGARGELTESWPRFPRRGGTRYLRWEPSTRRAGAMPADWPSGWGAPTATPTATARRASRS